MSISQIVSYFVKRIVVTSTALEANSLYEGTRFNEVSYLKNRFEWEGTRNFSFETSIKAYVEMLYYYQIFQSKTNEVLVLLFELAVNKILGR